MGRRNAIPSYLGRFFPGLLRRARGRLHDPSAALFLQSSGNLAPEAKLYYGIGDRLGQAFKIGEGF
jgi:hypothetical protein